ncbi:hypothetical protein BFW38_03360 [Terasakiispira papahanaumokuakeensis]|uniref:Uncharacterized protein n=1 Tax=Terasakiispira papahanaumokuakeensis TaxID=197479 RepID=A0A1E2V7A4_9GAMM|nr:hypothetical protein [Terasakiispira papahanaumokuakeensis]ODC02726.1 hypothetical protein BFW38_03360 [Terasakiispira papahanaumokuakeensis]
MINTVLNALRSEGFAASHSSQVQLATDSSESSLKALLSPLFESPIVGGLWDDPWPDTGACYQWCDRVPVRIDRYVVGVRPTFEVTLTAPDFSALNLAMQAVMQACDADTHWQCVKAEHVTLNERRCGRLTLWTGVRMTGPSLHLVSSEAASPNTMGAVEQVVTSTLAVILVAKPDALEALKSQVNQVLLGLVPAAGDSVLPVISPLAATGGRIQTHLGPELYWRGLYQYRDLASRQA